MSESEFVVNGMTCEHCTQALISAMYDVQDVTVADVNPVSGRVLLQHAGTMDRDAVEAAVDDAGYEVFSWAHPPQ